MVKLLVGATALWFGVRAAWRKVMSKDQVTPAPAAPAGNNASVVDAALVAEAARLGLPVRAVKAVMQVEAGGHPFGPDGRLLIRFEPHVFARLTAQAALGLKTRPTTAQRDQYGTIVLNPGMTSIDRPRERTGGQVGEWDTFQRASAHSPELAAQATSFGLGQIMGFNYAAAGYPSALTMMNAFARSAAEQVRGMLQFISHDARLVTAIKNNDFKKFAAVYNGAPEGTPDNTRYATRMRAAYDKLA